MELPNIIATPHRLSGHRLETKDVNYSKVLSELKSKHFKKIDKKKCDVVRNKCDN